MTATYTISDLAREFEVTTRTIRHYEDEGLLNPARQGTEPRLQRARSGAAQARAAREAPRIHACRRSRSSSISTTFPRTSTTSSKRSSPSSRSAKALLEQQREDIEVMLHEVEFFAAQCRKLLAAGPKGDAKAA